MSVKVAALATIVAIFGLSMVADAQSATVAQREEKRILDCTLESKTLDDCDPQGYIIRAAVFALPGLVIALCFLLICPWYCCCKYCCNCCGGRNQHPNFCCPNTELPARYSKGDIIRPKVLMFLALIASIAALVWSLTGVALLIGGLNNFALAVINVPDILTNEIDLIGNSLVIQKWDTTNNVTVRENLFDTTGASVKQEAEKTRDEMKALIQENMGNYQETLQDAQNALFALFIIPTVLIFLGNIFGFCNCRQFGPMTVVWFLFLFGFLMWLFHCVFSLTSMVVGDACAEISGLANKQLNLVSVLAACDDSLFSSFKSTFRQLEISQAESTCGTMQDLCWLSSDSTVNNLANGRVYECPANLQCSGMTFAELVDLMETSFFLHPSITTSNISGTEEYRCKTSDADAGGPCTVQRCADDCVHPTAGYRYSIGQTSKEIYVGFLGAKIISNVIDTLGARYATCDSVMSIIVAPFDKPCQEVTSGLIYDRQASGLMGLAIIGGVFVFAWGAKRFISLDEAEKAQRAGLAQPEENPE